MKQRVGEPLEDTVVGKNVHHSEIDFTQFMI